MRSMMPEQNSEQAAERHQNHSSDGAAPEKSDAVALSSRDPEQAQPSPHKSRSPVFLVNPLRPMKPESSEPPSITECRED